MSVEHYNKIIKRKGGGTAKVDKMTIEKMFGIESDGDYIARTSEAERVKEAMEYISGVISNEDYEEGYSTDKHIEDLEARGYFGKEKTQYIKVYFDGFKDGYNRAKGGNRK